MEDNELPPIMSRLPRKDEMKTRKTIERGLIAMPKLAEVEGMTKLKQE